MILMLVILNSKSLTTTQLCPVLTVFHMQLTSLLK